MKFNKSKAQIHMYRSIFIFLLVKHFIVIFLDQRLKKKNHKKKKQNKIDLYSYTFISTTTYTKINKIKRECRKV